MCKSTYFKQPLVRTICNCKERHTESNDKQDDYTILSIEDERLTHTDKYDTEMVHVQTVEWEVDGDVIREKKKFKTRNATFMWMVWW